VRAVFDGPARQGSNEAIWDGRDASSRTVSGGVYFCRLRALDQDLSSKVVVMAGAE